VSGRVALARAYADSGKADMARQELEKVVSAAPDNIAAQKLLAEIYRKDHLTDLLEKTCYRILALDATDAQAREALDWVRGQRENAGEPEAGGTEENYPPRIVTRTLAEIYASQGYSQRAFEIYEELSMRDPANPLFHARLAELKEKLIARNGRARGRPETEEEEG
jgi:predicted Zn-dependent protease